MTSANAEASSYDSAATGIEGLDDVLGGGFAPGQLFLVEGAPGSGKTTLALQFMMEGIRRKEPVLYITLSESRPELVASGRSHGWSLEELPVLEMMPPDASLLPDEQYTMFHPSEVELSETSKAILDEVDRVKPVRVVFDSLSEMRLISGNQLRFRRQILALKQFFASRQCTVLLLDDLSAVEPDFQLQSLAHGVIAMERVNPEFGEERRKLRVVKFRGRSYRGGFHDYRIVKGGLEVYPRLVAAEHRRPFIPRKLPSGVAELDGLLGGGLDLGTSTLLVGAAGTGKSTLSSQFVTSAAEAGYNAAMFIFDENIGTLLNRADGMGIGLRSHVEAGRVAIHQVDPAEMSPGELTHRIRQAVDEGPAKVIVIDSMNGYLNAMPGERYLVIQMHELLSYLGQRGVATIMVTAQHGIIGPQMSAPVDASYLADAIIMLRFFEASGQIRQALSVVKKRGGKHERTIREFSLDTGHIRVGEPLRAFRGVLTGVPTFEGTAETLMSGAR